MTRVSSLRRASKKSHDVARPQRIRALCPWSSRPCRLPCPCPQRPRRCRSYCRGLLVVLTRFAGVLAFEA